MTKSEVEAACWRSLRAVQHAQACANMACLASLEEDLFAVGLELHRVVEDLADGRNPRRIRPLD